MLGGIWVKRKEGGSSALAGGSWQWLVADAGSSWLVADTGESHQPTATSTSYQPLLRATSQPNRHQCIRQLRLILRQLNLHMFQRLRRPLERRIDILTPMMLRLGNDPQRLIARHRGPIAARRGERIEHVRN